MTNDDNPWSRPEVLAALSREPIGAELARLTAGKLSRDAERGRGLWNQHRDYCGHGLIFRDSCYELLAVMDGDPLASSVLLRWPDVDEFVSWLARQSDHSLSGADAEEAGLHTTVPSTLNNQRLTREKLKDYVHDCPASMAPFRDLLYAVDLELGFLVDVHGYRKHLPRMDGRECRINYRKLPHAGVTVVAEYGSTPFVTATFSADVAMASVPGLLAERKPGWQPPALPAQPDEAAYRSYLRAIADAMRTTFPELAGAQKAAPAAAVNAPAHELPELARADEVRQPEASAAGSRRRWRSPRFRGLAIVVLAFLALVAELRYFAGTGELPAATGSPKANLGMLLLLSVPWVVLVLGALQAVSGVGLRTLNAQFSSWPRSRRLGLSAVALGSAALATVAAAYLI